MVKFVFVFFKGVEKGRVFFPFLCSLLFFINE
nr:MAG TPA: hypothetical protein [Caudoviricetes sp.]